MVTAHTIRHLFRIASQDDIFSIKIDAINNHDICDLSNGIECHVHGNGEQNKGDVRFLAHPPPPSAILKND